MWWTLAVSARSMTLGAWPSVDSHALHTTCDNQGRPHTKFAEDRDNLGLTDYQFGLKASSPSSISIRAESVW